MFSKINYLKTGNARQQEVFDLLSHHKIFEKLSQFQPLLAGTIPINIDIHESDLDIICFWKIKDDFIQTLKELFGTYIDFTIKETTNRGHKTIICRFTTNSYPIEIFGQNRPSLEQEAYQHMLIEYDILEKKGEAFRRQIIELKKLGIKTEPAFAKLLGIEGNPYDELLKFKL